MPRWLHPPAFGVSPPRRLAARVHRKQQRPWKFYRKALATLFEHYGFIIRSHDDILERKLVHFMEKKTANTSSPSLKRMSVQAQLDGVLFLHRRRLHTFDAAVTSPYVELVDPKVSPARPRIAEHHRQFWDNALTPEVVQDALTELLADLSQKPAVRMLMAHGPKMRREPSWHTDRVYPKMAEVDIFTQALDLLSSVCFNFINKWQPQSQSRRKVECAEAFKLTEWLEFVGEEFEKGSISAARLCNGATIADYKRVSLRLRRMRNVSEHRGLQTTDKIAQDLQSGVELARMLGDERRTHQLELLREEVEKGPAFVEYLQARMAPMREKDMELAMFERVLLVLLQQFRDDRESFEEKIIEARTRIKNEMSIEQRETVLKIRSLYPPEKSAQKDHFENGQSFREWHEEKRAGKQDVEMPRDEKSPDTGSKDDAAASTSKKPGDEDLCSRLVAEAFTAASSKRPKNVSKQAPPPSDEEDFDFTEGDGRHSRTVTKQAPPSSINDQDPDITEDDKRPEQAPTIEHDLDFAEDGKCPEKVTAQAPPTNDQDPTSTEDGKRPEKVTQQAPTIEHDFDFSEGDGNHIFSHRKRL